MLKTETARPDLPFPDRWAPEIRGQAAADPLEPLAREHAEITALLRRVQYAPDGSTLGQELYEVIRCELLAHDAAAREVVLPELDGREAASVLLGEAEELDRLVARLDALHLATRAWRDAFAELSERAQAHFRSLERALVQCPPVDAVRLEGAFLRAKAREVDRLDQVDARA